ncbi:alpha/beta hydrolase family protein [Burkholderiaceae bacterium UC74_6]
MLPNARPAIFRGLIALVCAAWCGLAAADDPAADPPVPVERFFQQATVLGAKLSPSGKYLALTTAHGGKRVGLTVIEFGGSLRRIAEYADSDVRVFDWVSDDRLVFNVVDLQDGSGDDLYIGPGLYAVDVKGEAIQPLIKRHRGGSDYFADRRLLDMWHFLLHIPMQQPGVKPNEVIVGHMVAGDAGKPATLTPMWLDTVTGTTRKIDIKDAPTGVSSWVFDSKGEPRLATVVDKGRSSLYWRRPGQAAWQLLEESAVGHGSFEPDAVDDDGTLYVTHNEGPEGYAVLTRLDPETLKPVEPPLVRVPGFDFRGGLIQERAGGPALGVRVDADTEQTVWYDPAMKQFQAKVDGMFPGRVNRISCRRCGAPDMVALLRSYADRDPGVLLLYEADGDRWRVVSQVMDGIDPARMARVAFQRIKARDGRELPLWLTLPTTTAKGSPPPAVVMVHGGPWVRDGFWQWEPMKQFLASRGYLVISPEFRGSEGYGDVHYKAGWKQWGQAIQDDIADALLWAQQRGLAAPGRACIAGSSFGGYGTLMGLVRQPELYRCGIAWLALADPFLYLKGNWVVTDDLGDTSRRYTMPEMVGDAEKDKEMLTANSPVAQAERIKAPVLLAYGYRDVRVPLAHGTRLRRAMQDAGNPPEWVVYDYEAHGWRLLENKIDWARRMERFLDQHLKP